MKIKDVVETLERFAPLPLQESYDNAGLQIGLTAAEDVSGVLLCLDVTEEVLAEAVRERCNMVVSHHPLLFRALRRVTGRTQVERCVALALQHGLTLYAAHTNLDNVRDGVNYMIAEKLGLENVRMLQPLPDGKDGGSGVIGQLAAPENAVDFLQRVKREFRVAALRYAEGPSRPVRTVALCGGAGDFLLDVAVSQGADLFFTGEMGYHRFMGHSDELWLAELGHYESEQYTIRLMRNILQKNHPGLRLVETRVNTNPVRVM